MRGVMCVILVHLHTHHGGHGLLYCGLGGGYVTHKHPFRGAMGSHNQKGVKLHLL
jgi:hypothetical protein